jgi:O-antigen/teichoic acid export membrane protein
MSEGAALRGRPTPPGGGDTISRNAMFALATQLTTAAFTAALTVFLVRQLGPAGYGTLSLAMGVTGLLIRPAAGGSSQAAARYVAERRGDIPAIAGVLGMAGRFRLVSATLIAVALFALAQPISDLYRVPEMTWPLRALAVAFFGQSVTLFWRDVFVALRRTSSGFALILSESAMEFTATVTLVLVGGGVTAAAFGRTIGYLFGAFVGVILLTRVLGRSPLFGTGRSAVGRREFAGYAGAMVVITSAVSAFGQLNVLLIGAFLTTSSVGIYSAALRLITVLRYPGQALAQGIAPRLARHPDEPPNVRALSTGLGYMISFQAGVAAVLLVWAEPIVELVLGPEFLESAEVLRALTPLILLVGLSTLLSSALNYAGEGRRRMPVAIATFFVTAASGVILIPEIGILGAAVGSDVAYALYVGGHLWLCRRVLGLPLRPLAVTAGGSLAALGAMAAVLLAIGTGGQLSVIQWTAGLTLGSAAFVVTLVATRALSIGEIRFLLGLPARALRRT